MPLSSTTSATTGLTSSAPAPSRPASLESVLASARRVLEAEITAMAALRDQLGAPFGAAIDVLFGISGRVITTGMGKSGHIAVKIASTFSSTGTPALFVHPAEAGHGDLGMITEGDAILALSNSGETGELSAVLDYAGRRAIPLLAITARAGSTLARQSDIALVLPPFSEACPLGLAPTTSTTLQLALGDALAVALLERRGFGADDFLSLHPGGTLGRRLIRVDDVMHEGDSLPLARPGTPMSECLLIMTRTGFGCVGICDEWGRLIGIITDGDLRRHMAPDLLERTAAEVMSKGPQTVRPGALASEVLLRMETRAISAVFIVSSDGVPVGFVRLLDLLRLKVA